DHSADPIQVIGPVDDRYPPNQVFNGNEPEARQSAILRIIAVVAENEHVVCGHNEEFRIIARTTIGFFYDLVDRSTGKVLSIVRQGRVFARVITQEFAVDEGSVYMQPPGTQLNC